VRINYKHIIKEKVINRSASSDYVMGILEVALKSGALITITYFDDSKTEINGESERIVKALRGTK